MTSFQGYTSFIHRVLDDVEPLVLSLFRTPLTIEDKGGLAGFDPVTQADKEAERLIRRHILETYPDHGILGEEEGPYQLSSEWIWTLDPIDGTRAFMTGVPVWGTLIALSHGGKAHVGVLSQPYVGERFVGTPEGSFLHRGGKITPLKTRHGVSLEGAMGMTTSPDLFKGKEAGVFQRLKDSVRHIRYGTDCYGYAMLAAGNVDFVCETGLAPYDIRALIPLVENAGGVITTWTGGCPHDGGSVVASATPQLHEALLTLLSQG